MFSIISILKHAEFEEETWIALSLNDVFQRDNLISFDREDVKPKSIRRCPLTDPIKVSTFIIISSADRKISFRNFRRNLLTILAPIIVASCGGEIIKEFYSFPNEAHK